MGLLKMSLQPSSDFNPRVYSGFPGCKREEGTSVNGVLTTITGILLVIQMVYNIANNNNNVNTFDNIFVSMNENMAAAMMNMMFPGRQFTNSWSEDIEGKTSLVDIYLSELLRTLPDISL